MSDTTQQPPPQNAPAPANPAPPANTTPAPTTTTPPNPPAPASPAAPAAPAAPTPTASSEIETLRASTEKQLAQLRFDNQLSRAAATAGVKDFDFFEFLANRERATKGDAFNLDQFVTGLKTQRPELFHGAPASPAATAAPVAPAAGTGAPPNSNAAGANNDAKVAELRAAYAKAVEARNTARMLQIITELQKLGVTS
jgi:hypothetical protein